VKVLTEISSTEKILTDNVTEYNITLSQHLSRAIYFVNKWYNRPEVAAVQGT
jgi:hypothetical protein